MSLEDIDPYEQQKWQARNKDDKEPSADKKPDKKKKKSTEERTEDFINGLKKGDQINTKEGRFRVTRIQDDGEKTIIHREKLDREGLVTSIGDITADGLINARTELKSAYYQNSKWLVSRTFVNRAMKLKDGNGNYMWLQSLRVGEPDTLLGIRSEASEFVPAV